MKKLLGMVASPRGLLAIALIVVVALLFSVGPRFGITGEMRLLIIIGLLMVGMIVILLTGNRAKKKKSDDIERSLLLEADSLVMTSSGAQRQANEKAREELAKAIESLKKARGSRGRSALHDLPWYLVIGSEDSGKSTMVQNSGLTIPSGGDAGGGARHGVGPGRSIRWWFTQQAILLEANGRFVGREDDADASADFDAMLSAVQKARGETPIQGVVITIPADELVRHDSARLDEQAHVIRRRLDAVRDRLQVHCPVYLAVSKIDLVHGFDEFFADLEGNARDQVCGATLSVEQMEEEPERAFTREFDVLYRSLCQRRIPRMVTEEKAAVRGRVYLFPLEFQALKRKLKRFVKTLFETDTYGQRPRMRGFYFGSGHCEGEPVEMVVNEVSRVIGLPPDLDDAGDVTRVIDQLPAAARPPAPTAAPARASDPEPRFLRELFTRILLMDVPLAQPTEAAARRRRLRTLAFRAGGGALVLLVVLFLMISWVRNRSLLRSTVELARDAARVAGAPASASELENRLRLLDALRLRLEDLEHYERIRPLTLGMGMYRGREVGARARAVYLNRLTEVFLGPSRSELESRLFVTYPQSAEEYKDYFEAYRAYLMLIEPTRAVTGELAPELVEFWAGGREGATEGLRTLIPAHVEYAWNDGGADVNYHSANLPARNAALVARASQNIRDYWRPEFYYRAMIDEVNDAVPAFALARVAGAGGLLETDRALLAEDPECGAVPGAYTVQGWREGVRDRIENSENQLRNDWILKEVYEGHTLDMRDWLLDTYRKDYLASWVRFLAAVDVAPSVSAAQAADRLRELSGRSSALVRLVDQAASQLRFRTGGAGGGDEVLASLEDDFAMLHALFRMEGEGDQQSRPVDRWSADIAGLVDLLRGLEESGDVGLASTTTAKEILATVGPGTNQIPRAIAGMSRWASDVRGGRKECSDAVLALLHRPAEAAWGALLAESQLYLDAAWSVEIWEPFRTLNGNYPFLPTGPDASLSEFQRFFAPGGIFFSFYDAELAPFLDRERQPRLLWRHGLRFGPTTLDVIERAFEFRRALFSETPGELGFTVRVTPGQTEKVSGSPPYRKATRLVVGGDRVVYGMGAQIEEEITWPGETGGARVDVDVDGLPPNALTADGAWAFFRLVAQARVEPETDNVLKVSWELTRPGDYSIRVPYRFRTASRTHAFQPGFFEFPCPRQIGPTAAEGAAAGAAAAGG